MLNPTKLRSLNELITGLGYNCVIAGSSVYLEEGQAGDIDVYVDFYNRDINKFEGDLLDQLTMEGDYVLQEKQQVGNKAYADGCSWIKKVVDLKDEDGDIISVIATDLLHVNAYPMAVLNTFDYGRIQIGYTSQGLVKTEAYDKDVENRTLTLLNVWSKYHLKAMGKRIDKMQTRFPDHRIVITPDFYHDPGVKKRTYATKTKYPGTFYQAVIQAQNAMRAQNAFDLDGQAF